MRAGVVVVFACLLVPSCGSSESVGVPDQGDTSITTTLKENVADSVTTSLPSAEGNGSAQVGADEAPAKGSTESNDSTGAGVDDGRKVAVSSTTTVPSSTSIAPPTTADLDTVVPEDPEIFTEEPSNDSGLFGTDEPGSSA